MQTLIVKLGATGDVVRTTPLLRKLRGNVAWLTDQRNKVLLDGLSSRVQSFSWEERESLPRGGYDLVINLEDTLEVARFLQRFQSEKWFGAYATGGGEVHYTIDSRGWFDLSLISCYGREEADRLKYRNRSSYQGLIFDGLGFAFDGETYLLPAPKKTELRGDVALATEAGSVWPMKNWAYYHDLKRRLEGEGLIVNILPARGSLLEHLADVCNHRCLVSGDSLPMHFALGTATPCVTLFNCTSPWEIYDYGVQKKLISPLLGEFFYQRGYDPRATMALKFPAVLETVKESLALARETRIKIANEGDGVAHFAI